MNIIYFYKKAKNIGRKIGISIALLSLCTLSLLASTYSVNTKTGTWSVHSGENELSCIRTILNKQNALKGAVLKNGIYRKTIDGLEVALTFSIKQNKWVCLDIQVTNPTQLPINIISFESFNTDCHNALKGTAAEDLRIMWESPIYDIGKAENRNSAYYGCIYSETNHDGPAWMIGHCPPINWTSRVKKSGNTLSGDIDFRNRPYIVDPGEIVHFDSVVMSADYSTLEAWPAFGKAFYKPFMPASEEIQNSGYNTWEYFRGDINSKCITPSLEALSMWKRKNKVKELRYFVLDDGWFRDRGCWTFDTTKFPEGEKGWADKVKAAGFEPGVWIAPFWSNKEIVEKYNMTLMKYDEKGSIHYQLDPSCPNVQKYVLGRFKALRESGYKYFKIDFLYITYQEFKNTPFKYSKAQPEKVIGDFLAKIRKAIGPDAYLLGCATPMTTCVQQCNSARIMSDITPNWNVTKEIYRHIAARYWMNGNLFVNNPDFFVARGKDFVKDNFDLGSSDPNGPRGFEGFDAIKMHTWATIIFASGGKVVWSDQPEAMKDEVWNTYKTLMETGPGEAGVPLDLLDTDYPTRWIRHNRKKTYAIFINVKNEPVNVTMTKQELPELTCKRKLVEVFTGQSKKHLGGDLTVTLQPYESMCYKVK